MTGSIKWMAYGSDDGNGYAVLIDESNGIAGGFADITADGGVPAIPRYMKMRYVTGVAADGTTARLKIGSATNTLFTTGGTFTQNGVTYAVSSRRGEQNRIVRAADTGKTDGDAS